MDIHAITAVRDEEISRPGADFFSIVVNGEVMLECVAKQDVGAAIGEILRNPARFFDLY